MDEGEGKKYYITLHGLSWMHLYKGLVVSVSRYIRSRSWNWSLLCCCSPQEPPEKARLRKPCALCIPFLDSTPPYCPNRYTTASISIPLTGRPSLVLRSGNHSSECWTSCLIEMHSRGRTQARLCLESSHNRKTNRATDLANMSLTLMLLSLCCTY